MLLRFYPYVGIWRFYMVMYVWVCDMNILEMYVIYPLRFSRNFYMHVLRFIGDMTSISWIFVLFACFITLIEVRRYKLVSELWSVLSRPRPGDFPCCMRHVREYCRYLLCCYVLLGGFEHNGGVAVCFRCIWSGKGGIFGCRGSVGCGLCQGSYWFWMMFTSLKETSEKGVGNLPVVQEFLEVFSDDITELP